jgi:hypothetical protein
MPVSYEEAVLGQGVSEIRVLILNGLKNSPIYETFFYNIWQKMFRPPIFTKRVVLCD